MSMKFLIDARINCFIINVYRSINSLLLTLSLYSLKSYLKYFERYNLDLHICDVYTVRRAISQAFEEYCDDV